MTGVLTIAFADAFSDGLGIHIFKKSENQHTRQETWVFTISTIIAKMVFALTFALPVIIFSLLTALIVSVI